MPDKTPLEKLKKANDEMHEAVEEIMLDEDTSVEKKCEIGQPLTEIFARLEIVYEILEAV